MSHEPPSAKGRKLSKADGAIRSISSLPNLPVQAAAPPVPVGVPPIPANVAYNATMARERPVSASYASLQQSQRPGVMPMRPGLQTSGGHLPPSKLNTIPNSMPRSGVNRQPTLPNLDGPPTPGGLRAVSSPPVSRQQKPPSPSRPTPVALPTATSQGAGIVVQKKRGFFGSKEKTKDTEASTSAWIAGQADKVTYDMHPLLTGSVVPELWDDVYGDTLIYLFPKSSGKGASFKLPSSVIAPSNMLWKVAHDGTMQKHNPRLSIPHFAQAGLATPPHSPQFQAVDINYPGPSDLLHLYLPLPLEPEASGSNGKFTLTKKDIDTLVGARNLFAFLMGQSLIATPGRPSLFSIFIQISNLLNHFAFSSPDGSTFGDAATSSFNNYIDELLLGDLRFSHEKTMDMLIVAEHMRGAQLYNEAFIHAVGKYDDLQKMARTAGPDSRFNQISSVTRTRLERGAIDLANRQKSVDLRLFDFEFPGLWSGVMNSKSAEEGRMVNFTAWKEIFLKTRRHVLGYLSSRWGNWPPKASNKKNQLQSDGLSRTVLTELYHDLCQMYDFYVDRTSLTTRSSEFTPVSAPQNAGQVRPSPPQRALRKVFDEYDRSSPPVLPPIPFDTPLLPSLKFTRKDYGKNINADVAARSKKLKEDEMIQLLGITSNADDIPSAPPAQTARSQPMTKGQLAASSTPFLDSIRAFERSQAKGCTVDELVDLRCGMWMFMYVVLQTLPMLVVDAPSIKHAKGVEYFLCIPPRGGLPWMTGDYGKQGKGATAGEGIESSYLRSHCWQMASKWAVAAGGTPIMASAMAAAMASQHNLANASQQNLISSGIVTESPRISAEEIRQQTQQYHSRHRSSADDIRRSASGSFDETRAQNQAAARELGLPLPPLLTDSLGSANATVTPVGYGTEGTTQSPQSLSVSNSRTGSPARKPVSGGATPTGSGTSSPKTFDDIIASMKEERGRKDKRYSSLR